MIEWLQFNEFERRLEELECFGSSCFNRYYLDEPEDRRFNWIAVRNKIGEVEQVVARYGDRCATEHVARLMSLEDHAIYQVKEERDNGKKGLSFQQGEIVVMP